MLFSSETHGDRRDGISIHAQCLPNCPSCGSPTTELLLPLWMRWTHQLLQGRQLLE